MILSRRTFLHSTFALATAARLQHAAHALGFLAGGEVCRLTPEQEQGPYYVAEEMLRSNIVEGRQGVPLALRIALLDARSCKPLANAAVDIWHCDAVGLYSGFTKQSAMGPGGPPPNGRGGPPPDFGLGGPPPDGPGGNRTGGPPPGMGGPPENHPTDKLTFLRGIQITDSHGVVHFETIFPGFYMGRTNRIHFKVRVDGHSTNHTYQAGHTSHTGQIFFPEDLTLTLMEQPPYTRHRIHRTTQVEDGVFGGQQGKLSIANMKALAGGDHRSGFAAEIIASVDPTSTPGPARRMGGPASGRGGSEQRPPASGTIRG